MSEFLQSDKFLRLPIAKVMTPWNGCRVIVGHWWVVTPEGDVLIYKGEGAYTPQCNRDRRVTARLAPSFDSIYLPVAYVSPRP